MRTLLGTDVRGRTGRRGGALALSLMVVFVIAVLAASFLRMSSGYTRHQSQSVDRKRAFYLAEAGLAEAFSGVTFGRSGRVGSRARPAVFGDGLFWVEVEDLGQEQIELRSTGMCGIGSATLSMVIERGSIGVASLGVFSGSSMSIPEGVLIDAYDSSKGEYEPPSPGAAPGQANKNKNKKEGPRAHVGSNGSIMIRSTREEPTQILGDVTPGPYGQVQVSGAAVISGSTDPGVEVQLPWLAFPEGPLEPGILQDNELPLIVRADDVGYEFLHVTENTDLVIAGPGQLVLNELRVEPGGSLSFDTSEGAIELLVRGGIDLAEDSLVSTSSKDPSQVSISIAHYGPAHLDATGSFHGQIVGPSARMHVGSSFELFGAIAGDHLTLEPGAKLHFDHFLTLLADEMAVPDFVTWRIVDLATPKRTQFANDPFKILGVRRSSLLDPASAHEDQVLKISYYDTCGTLKHYEGLESAFDWTDVDVIVGGWRGGGFASLTGGSGTLLIK